MAGWQHEPFPIEVKAGDTKAFCLCGLSKKAPYCDGSHATTQITPQVITFDEEKVIYACGCRQSGNLPYAGHSGIAYPLSPEL